MNNPLNNSQDFCAHSSEKEKNINLFKVTKLDNSKQLLLEKDNPIIEINQSNGLNTKFLEKKRQILDDLTNIKKEATIEEKEVKSIPWTKEDDNLLLMTAKQNNEKNWKKVASSFKGRTSIQCSSRYHRIKPGLTKGHFTREEDLKLISLYNIYGKKWNLIAKEMKNRTGKQIRDRFLNSLAPGVNKKRFTLEEDKKILKYYKIYGKSWSSIAKYINGRTGDMIKNRFYSYLSKNSNKDKFMQDDLNEEEKLENNIENKINEPIEQANYNVISNLNEFNVQNNNIIQNYGNIFSNNAIINNNNNNNNNLYMNNYLGNQNYFLSNLLFSDLLRKENTINTNNYININLNFQNQNGIGIFKNNEINNKYNFNYNYNYFDNINNSINNNINYNNKEIPYIINPNFKFKNNNMEQKFYICKTFSLSL